jgi:hypothetical protein
VTGWDIIERARRAATGPTHRRWSLRAPGAARGCVAHRTVLLEVLDGRPRDDAVTAALEHLARCRACEQDVGELSLVITGLRRLGRSARRAEPGPDGWARFMVRLDRRRGAVLRASLAPLAGLLAVPLMLAILVGPAGSSPAVSDGGTPDMAASAVVDVLPDAPAAAAAHAAATRQVNVDVAEKSAADGAVAVADIAVADTAVTDAGASHGPLPDGMSLQQSAPAGQQTAPLRVNTLIAR